ncbi:hypothetical protein T439DRAFT_357703 [Meredithblackwellia eburnea MCA 4105]
MLSTPIASTTILLISSTLAMALSIEKRSTLSSPGVCGFQNPTLRGWDSSTVTTGPCGGIGTIYRTNWPLGGGSIALEIQKASDDVILSYSTSSNPTSAQFTQFASLGDVSSAGYRCVSAPDFSSMGLSAGQEITFQVAYQNSDDSKRYQCADVTLVAAEDYFVSTSFTCSNSSGLLSSSNPSSSRGLTAVQAGWTGACVTLLVLLLPMILGWYFGFLFFRNNTSRRSTTTSGGQRGNLKLKFAYPPQEGAQTTTTAQSSHVELRGSEGQMGRNDIRLDEDNLSLGQTMTYDSTRKH